MKPQTTKLDRHTLQIILIGFGISFLCLLLTKTRNFFLCLPAIVLHCFSTLCHEIGHSLFAWIFGYPSIPAFDFKYGGGVAISFHRQTLILLFVYAGFALLIYLLRKNLAALIIVFSIVALHLIFAFTSLHQILILFMGHGGELLFATLFLYRSWTAHSTFHEQERLAYAICGFFMVLKNFAFSYNLYSSHTARIIYGMAKGGGHWMDFSRIAHNYLHVKLASVALLFCFCCFIPVIVSYLLYRYKEHVNLLLGKLTEVE